LAKLVLTKKDQLVFASAPTCSLLGDEYVHIGGLAVQHKINEVDLSADKRHITMGIITIDKDLYTIRRRLRGQD
jgi:hypothetical protein